ncbi:MAG: tRNA (adenine-N1)-methyltransferase [Candidatus Pacearchaeota archaeon]
MSNKKENKISGVPFQEGDYVLIVHNEKRFLRRLHEKMVLNVKKDVIKFENIVGKKEGEKVGNFYLFRPTIEDIIFLGFKRKTQIIYPKDSFFIAFKLNIKKEDKVLEIGTGSGALTAVLSRLAKKVYTFEISKQFYKLALKNWKKFDLCKNVKAINADFQKVKLKKDFFDACFVDVKEPWLYLKKIWQSLKPGKVCGFLFPTVNQVCKLLNEIEPFFTDIEVFEILIRYYKPNPERLRPKDRMIAHTGYLVFCKKKIE